MAVALFAAALALAAPTADFTIAPNPALPGETVTLDATGTSGNGTVHYGWETDGDDDFDDLADQVSVTTSFAAAGTHTVKLLATDDDGDAAPVEKTVTVNTPPEAGTIDVAPGSREPGQPIGFSTTGTLDADGQTLTYGWDFDTDDDFSDSTSAAPTHTFTTNGNKTVRVKVTDTLGGEDTAEVVVKINTAPVAGTIQALPADPLPNESISFSTSGASDADGDALTYGWDFDNDDDFSDSTSATPSHTFTTAGTRTVRVRVTDSLGDTDTAQLQVTVNTPPDAGTIEFTPPEPAPGDSIGFSTTGTTDADGHALSYGWDFDNDDVFTDSTSATPSHTFTSAGNKTVRVKVTDTLGGEEIAQVVVTVNTPPDAGTIQFTPAKPLPNQSVSFSTTGTADADGQTLTYGWDFDNDGVFTDSTSASPSHTFTGAGNKTVKVKVTDTLGGEDIAQVSVVVNTPPTANFNFSPGAPQPGQEVTFTSSSSDAEDTAAQLTYQWDFDGGTFDVDSTDKDPKHTFATSGEYDVTLRVTDQLGESRDKTLKVTVNTPPVAGFTHSPPKPVPGQTVSFVSASNDAEDTPGELTYEWDFEGGAFDVDSTAQNPSRSFSTAGAHSVTLRVTDTLGGTDSETVVVTVNDPPDASFTVDPAAPVQGEPVTFTDTSTDPDGGSIVSREWDTDGDGNYDDGTGTEASDTYAADEDPTVSLRVTDNDGGVSVASQEINIDNLAPTASFNFFPANPVTGETVTFTSTSADPDGPIKSLQWDLDGDGVFGESGETGVSVSTSFATAGTVNVALRVTDREGVTDVATQSIEVADPPPPPPPPSATTPSTTPSTTPAGPQLISPFPVVRVRGRFRRDGTTLITSLSVDAPSGAKVTLRCRGRGCPFRRQSRTAAVKRVRFARIRKALRAGTVLEIVVTQRNSVGKYTSFRMRAGKAPVRRDLCMKPRAKKPTRCPA